MNKVQPKKYFNIVKASDTKGEIYIYDNIVPAGWEYGEEVSAANFRDELQSLEGVNLIELHINSDGGDVFEASAIYNMLKRHKARIEVSIDGLAASAASVVAMAGDKVVMPQNAMLMIHNAWSFFMGNHNDFRKFADDLEKINDSSVKQAYLSKNPDLDVEELTRMMDAETWLTANEALELGLVDEVTKPMQAAASISKDFAARYKNTPSELVEKKNNSLSTTVNIAINDELKEAIQAMQKRLDELEANNTKEKPIKNDWLF